MTNPPNALGYINPITDQATKMARDHLRLVGDAPPIVRDDYYLAVAADVRAAWPQPAPAPRKFKFWRWTISIERNRA